MSYQHRQGLESPSQATTLDSYNQSASAWASAHQSQEFYWGEEIKERFQAYLAPGKSLVEIGCGGLRDANHFLLDNYTYAGTDASVGMIQESQRQFPQVRLEVADILNWPAHLRGFDGFWAAACLLHLEKHQMATALENIVEACQPKAVGFISLKGELSGGPATGMQHDQYGSRWFTYWSRQTFDEVLHQFGIQVLHFKHITASPKTHWHCYIVQLPQ